jgi:Domain of unknown function (DUF6968)
MLILNRLLKIDAEGYQTEVPVRIYLPVNAGDRWQCEYEIGWPEYLRRSRAFGVDSMQSLLIALQKVGAEIYTSEAHKAGKLSWLEPGDGYGFPLPAGIRDLYEGNDRLFFVINASLDMQVASGST